MLIWQMMNDGDYFMFSQIYFSSNDTGSHSNLKKIVIAEDDEDLREIYKAALKGQYVIKTAKNGKEAIDISKKWKPDLVLIDVKMPIINGLEASQKILEDQKDVKIIAISAQKCMSREKINNIGIKQFIQRPIRLEQLTKTIKHVLEEKNMNSRNNKNNS
ncbi:MAG: response regulator [Candidatus Heimdallarchaeaceae archaeon]